MKVLCNEYYLYTGTGTGTVPKHVPVPSIYKYQQFPRYSMYELLVLSLLQVGLYLYRYIGECVTTRRSLWSPGKRRGQTFRNGINHECVRSNGIITEVELTTPCIVLVLVQYKYYYPYCNSLQVPSGKRLSLVQALSYVLISHTRTSCVRELVSPV